jgi:regulator of protease activity HflC (stomatin/prohibitin superfamily)
MIGIFQPFVLERVDAGSVGLQVKLSGDSRGVSKYTYNTGWNVYATWTDQLVEIPASQQHIDYDTTQVITKGGFPAKIKPTFNYSIKPEMAGDMYINLRSMIPSNGGPNALKQVEQGWLFNAIISSINDVSNRWVVDSIFNAREQFENEIVAECNKRVSKWFKVSQLRSNIVPPPALQASIIAKTKSIQDAQTEDQKAKTAISIMNRKIAEAKGDSAYNVTIANGEGQAALLTAQYEAKSMKEKQKELTPIYVEYSKVMKWDGKNPTTVLGSNTGVMIGK